LLQCGQIGAIEDLESDSSQKVLSEDGSLVKIELFFLFALDRRETEGSRGQDLFPGSTNSALTLPLVREAIHELAVGSADRVGVAS
jgi:hypothetical protein